MNELPSSDRLIRKPEVIARTSLSESSIWRREAEGRFPSRIRITPRTTVWRESEIAEWLRSPETYQRPSDDGGAEDE